jgi:hypothetical protein
VCGPCAGCAAARGQGDPLQPPFNASRRVSQVTCTLLGPGSHRSRTGQQSSSARAVAPLQSAARRLALAVRALLWKAVCLVTLGNLVTPATGRAHGVLQAGSSADTRAAQQRAGCRQGAAAGLGSHGERVRAVGWPPAAGLAPRPPWNVLRQTRAECMLEFLVFQDTRRLSVLRRQQQLPAV